MDEYAGRILAGRYRLPAPPAGVLDPTETSAFDTYSGQEVFIRCLPLPEVVSADDPPDPGGSSRPAEADTSEAARRALEAARRAAAVPDHPRLVQVFDVLIEGGSLWVVSELLPARSLTALLADRPLSPYRAAELGADVLGGLRALHAQGWTHRNITTGTVLVCADGRAMLDGLALGAAQEALCGYDPLPEHAPAAAGASAGAAEPAGAAESGGDQSRERAAATAVQRGPDSALAMERARQTRMAVVGPVTERWSPEQACPVQANWQLAPPVGPAADLWALGALMYRCVQGRAPFPEEGAAELAALVCTRPPAPAEECGPLRPVVESLLRQDPTERAGFEELRGWLGSLMRCAPEPDLGTRLVQVPADPGRLPIQRRKGELARTAAGGAAVPAAHGRHARSRRPPSAAALMPPRDSGRLPRDSGRPPRGSRRLGAMLLALILVLVFAAVAYAVLFMPRSQAGVRGGALPPPATASSPAATGAGRGPTTQTATTSPLPPGFTVRSDPAGFSIAVHDGWTRGVNGAQIVYSSSDGAFQLIVVPGRDSAATYGSDPMAYQTGTEPELAAFRASTWSSSSGLRRLTVDGADAAEGEFVWLDSGRHRYARNLAILTGGGYHLILVVGPDAERDPVSEAFSAAVQTYRPGS